MPVLCIVLCGTEKQTHINLVTNLTNFTVVICVLFFRVKKIESHMRQGKRDVICE